MAKSEHQWVKKAIACASIFVLSACSGLQQKQQDLQSKHQSFYQDYEYNLQQFNQEIDVSLQLRKRSLEFFKQEKLEGEAQYFNSLDISRIQNAVAEYADNRKILLQDIAYRYRQLIENVELKFTLQNDSGLASTSGILGMSAKNILYVNPNDETGRQYIKVIKLGLASALTLYDNFIIAIMPYQQNGHFRRSINYDNLENKKMVEEISGNFRRLDNYKDTLKVVEFNDLVRMWEKDNDRSKLVIDKDNAYFNLLIDGSYTNKRIKEITLWDRLAYRTVRFRRILRDILTDSGNESMSAVSKIFGNSMGLIATREGYLKNLPRSQKQKIEEELKPGDILLEKTPFRLTDRFIPGHWGHVAIWVGSTEQLQELGVWDKLPDLYLRAQKRFDYKGPSFQSQILDGRKIIEALRPGVQINTLDHFLDIDDMAVLRDKKVSQEALKHYVIRAFEQVGKEYDFNFDVETDSRIVCSELAFVAYDDYDWPVAKTAGRYTISPDHVGEKAIDGGPFETIMLYHDGKIIINNLQLNFSRLLHSDYQAIQADLVPL